MSLTRYKKTKHHNRKNSEDEEITSICPEEVNLDTEHPKPQGANRSQSAKRSPAHTDNLLEIDECFGAEKSKDRQSFSFLSASARRT
jgi:hypothetical protein